MCSDGSVTLAWCDSGMVYGEFTNSLLNLVMNNKKIAGIIRSQGKNIGIQRQEVLDFWIKEYEDSEWLLWVDSDIEFSQEDFDKLFLSADKDTRPVVAAIYLLLLNKDSDGTMLPSLSFNYESLESLTGVNKVNSTGFGMILIHKSVVEKMYSAFGTKHLFNSIQENKENEFIGEDVYFCKLLNEIEVPIHVNCDVFVKHHKTYVLDKNYLNLFWR